MTSLDENSLILTKLVSSVNGALVRSNHQRTLFCTEYFLVDAVRWV